MDPDEVARWIRPGSDHTPRTAAVTLENTHNFHGGAVIPIENLRAIREICLERDVPVHFDGARIWNAAAATGIPLTQYADLCDTMTVCLSKGLGAPVGSVAMGSEDTIRRARLFRKRLGGGMRQSGLLAAAGLVAIDTMRDRLVEDHANARRLAEGMVAIPGLSVDLDAVETNILFVRIAGMSPEGFVTRLAERGILTFDTGPDVCRFVTHADVDADDVDRAIEALSELFA
jgi:threonine aldolase